MTDKGNKAQRFLKSSALMVGGLVLLPIFAFAYFWFYGEVVLGPDHKPSFLAKVTVDLVVDGEPVLIEKIIECKTFELPGGELFERLRRGKNIPTKYFPTVRAFGAKLKSGAAIMMLTPYKCDHEVLDDYWLWRNIQVTPNPPGALPMMAWTADADNPDMVEVYASHAYFDHPDARVKVNRIEVANAPSGADPDPWGPYGWFVGTDTYYSEGLSLKSGDSYDSLGAVVIPKKVWEKYELPKTSLFGFNKVSLLPKELSTQIYDALMDDFVSFNNSIGYRGYFQWLPHSGKFVVGKNNNQARYLINFSTPFQFNNGVFSYESSSLPRFLAHPGGDLYKFRKTNVVFVLGEKFSDINLRRQNFFYDPSRQEILITHSFTFTTNSANLMQQ